MTIKPETAFTTEGDLHFLDPASHFNRIMTHNLPLWASHQAFDFQFKPDGKTLVVGDDYMVEHWLACYAVLLLS